MTAHVSAARLSSTWMKVAQDSKTYFHDTASGASTWIPSIQAIEERLARLEFSASEGSVPQGPDADREAIKEALNNLADDGTVREEDDDHLTQQSWVVKLHPDSGQVFYTEETQKLATWHNPFGGESLSEMLDMVDRQQQRENEIAEQEKLAGFDLAPVQEVFKSEQVTTAKQRLGEWMARNKIELAEQEGAKLKFPEYVDFSRDLSKINNFRISVLLPMGASEGFRSITISCGPVDSVQQLIEQTFSKFQIRENRELDPDGPGRYVLKVVGYSDYLIHTEYLLGFYDYLVWAWRKKIKIELELFRLSDADLMDLAPVLEKTLAEGIREAHRHSSPDGDDWTEDEQRLVPREPLLNAKRPVEISEIPLHEIQWPFRCIVRGIENCPTDIPVEQVFVEMQLIYNGEPLPSAGNNLSLQMQAMLSPGSKAKPTDAYCTAAVPFSSEPRFPTKALSTNIDVSALPPTTRVAFMVYGQNSSHQKIALAGVAITLVDYNRILVAGKRLLKLWPHQNVQLARDPTLGPKGESLPHYLNLANGVVGENPEENGGILHVVFDSYPLPVRAVVPTYNECKMPQMLERTHLFRESISLSALEVPSPKDREKLDVIERMDSIRKLQPDEKQLLWRLRQYCTSKPGLLPKFLMAVDWTNPTAVKETYKLLIQWEPFPPDMRLDALELLDIRFSDLVVREYAVRQIDQLPDHELAEVLLQLVQVLKYEPYHDSPLARMLLRRAVLAPYRIGHQLFWLLRSEMHNPDIAERFGVLLFMYLNRCGPHRMYIRRQVVVNDKIRVIAEQIKTISNKARRVEFARQELAKLNPYLPSRFQLCLSPRVECKGIIAEKCNVMSSKKLPLWLCFENADPNGENYLAIFKAGDDLRQDQMTLQLLRVMDKIWTTPPHNLDLRLNPYGCCATGKDLGMIEVVKNSATTAQITVDYGGRTVGAFIKTPIDQFLREHNKDAEYVTAVENFVHTCAGYCVATYVLGIGDRHNDNIMVTKSGHLFHIDFGHFLGNFKSKFGIKRERAPFVFTPSMAYVMQGSGGLTIKDFERMCCEAYNLVRARGNLLINMFILMVPAGMPELLEQDDIVYLRDQLGLDRTVEQAAKHFKKEIQNSLNSVSRQVDNWFHIQKHA